IQVNKIPILHSLHSLDLFTKDFVLLLEFFKLFVLFHYWWLWLALPDQGEIPVITIDVISTNCSGFMYFYSKPLFIGLVKKIFNAYPPNILFSLVCNGNIILYNKVFLSISTLNNMQPRN